MRKKRSKEFHLGNAYGNQQTTNEEKFAGFGVPNCLRQENDRCQKQQSKRDSAMEPA